MDDRELLERAAKAVGYDTSHEWNAYRLTLNPPVIALCIPGVRSGWNPLEDDGLALRLVISLGMNVDVRNGVVICEEVFIQLKQGDDPYAATRRAIVRAAAALGATNKEGEGNG